MSKPKTFFIAGVQRSGTTLLSVLLGNHSAIDMDGFSTVFRMMTCYQNYQSVLPYNLHLPAKKVLQWKIETDYKGRLADFLDHENIDKYDNYQDLVNASIEQRLIKKGKTVWGDKSPNLQHYLPDLLRLLPDAKVIHIVRDGRATAYSNSVRAHKHLLRAAQEWVDGNILAITNQQLLGEERYLVIKYEDLLRNPREILQQVCAFLALDFEKKMLKMNGDETVDEKDRYVKSRFDVAKIDQFKTQISIKNLAKIEQIQGSLLTHFGYELMQQNPSQKSHPLSTRRQIWYRQLDNIRMLFRGKRMGMVNRKNVEIRISWRNRLTKFLMNFGKDFFPKPWYEWLWQKGYNKGKYWRK